MKCVFYSETDDDSVNGDKTIEAIVFIGDPALNCINEAENIGLLKRVTKLILISIAYQIAESFPESVLAASSSQRVAPGTTLQDKVSLLIGRPLETIIKTESIQ